MSTTSTEYDECLHLLKRLTGIVGLPTRTGIQPFCHKLDNPLEQVCLLCVC